jgi:hypothetical protein
LQEVDALDDPAVLNVETGDDAFGQHTPRRGFISK